MHFASEASKYASMRPLHAEASVLWMPNLLVPRFDSSSSDSATIQTFIFDTALVLLIVLGYMLQESAVEEIILK